MDLFVYHCIFRQRLVQVSYNKIQDPPPVISTSDLLQVTYFKIHLGFPAAPVLHPLLYFSRPEEPVMSASNELSYSDVSEHNSKKDLYVVVHDKVYNATSFVDEHPYVFHGVSALQDKNQTPCCIID